MQLAATGQCLWPVSHTVNHQAACSANPFAAVIIKFNGFFLPFVYNLLIQHIEHIYEGPMLIDISDIIIDQLTGLIRAFLSAILEMDSRFFSHFGYFLLVIYHRIPE